MPFSGADSPLHNLMSKNGFLTDGDIQTIRDYMPAIEREQQRLDDEINVLLGRVEELKKEKKRVEKFEALHLAQLAPSRRCPPEVISEVMIWCAYMYRDQFPRTNNAPLVFLNVSRRWRAIALSEPRLWTYVTCDVGAIRTLPLWQAWLPRSRELPLTVRLRHSSYHCTRFPCPIMAVLLETVHRWQRLDSKMPSTSFFQTLRDPFPEDYPKFPMLESLTIDRQFHHRDLFQSADTLTQVTVSMSSYQFREVELPYDNLTSWVFENADVSDCLYLLERAPKLQTLKCKSLVSKDKAAKAANSPLLMVHPSLHTLSVTCPTQEDLSAFLGSLLLPGLRSLTVHQLERSTGLSPTFCAFIERCGQKVESLYLEVSCFGPILPACLVHTPNIVTLELGCWSLAKPSFNNALLTTLTAHKSGHDDHSKSTTPVLLSKLRHLAFKGVFDFTTEAVMEMARSRLGDQAKESGFERMKMLRLQMENPFSALNPDVYPKLKDLGPEGLSVVFNCAIRTIWEVYGQS